MNQWSMKVGVSSTIIGIGLGLLISYAGVVLDLRLEYVLIGLLFFIVFIALLAKYRLAFLWFVLFSTFGVMNVSVKPFDILFLCMAVGLVLVREMKKSLFRSLTAVHASIGSFLVLSCLSVISSANTSLGVSYLANTLFVISIFYTLVLFVRHEKEYKGIVWGYCVSAIFSAVVVLGELFGVFYQTGTLFQGLRAKGFFLDPNDFSPFLIFAILFLFEKYTNESYTSWRFYAYVLVLILLIAVLLAALSRAAILHFFVSFTIYLVYSLRDKRVYPSIAFFFLVLISTACLSFYMKKEYIAQQLALRFYDGEGVLQGYDFDRFYYQLEGLKLGSAHLFGIGPGQFEFLMNYATHNLYIRVIAENGWMAFLCFAFFLLYVFRYLFKYRKESVWGLPVYLFLAAYVGLLVNSFFIDTLHWRYLWFLVGMGVVLVHNVKNVGEERR